MSNVIDLERERARRAIDTSIAEIRACGMQVEVVADHGHWCVVRGHEVGYTADAVEVDEAVDDWGRVHAFDLLVIDPLDAVSPRLRAIRKRAEAGGQLTLDDVALLAQANGESEPFGWAR